MKICDCCGLEVDEKSEDIVQEGNNAFCNVICLDLYYTCRFDEDDE